MRLQTFRRPYSATVKPLHDDANNTEAKYPMTGAKCWMNHPNYMDILPREEDMTDLRDRIGYIKGRFNHEMLQLAMT